jgi:hypothetical protein
MLRRREADVMDLPTAENIKNSKLALIAGLLIGLSLGAGGAWTASTTIHAAQFKVLGAVNEDLLRQVFELRESSQAKDAEMNRLREQISVLSPQRREAELKRRTELERLIQQIDKEISLRWAGLSRGGVRMRSKECDPKGENCRMVDSDYDPMSDREKRIERELDVLVLQRHEARKKLIDLIAR